jgi:hypothetical protein
VTKGDSGDSGESSRPLLMEAGFEFLEDPAVRLGAGLAYRALTTVALLLVLLVGVCGQRES